MSLSALRSEIEKIDARIVELLNRRTALSIEIGKVKRATKRDFFAPDREKALLRSLVELNRKTPGPLRKADLHAIYREIFSRSRAHQKCLKIGYVKDEAAYVAATRHFGSGEKYVRMKTAKALLDALRKGAVHAGVSPSVPKGLRGFGTVAGSYRLVVADSRGKEKA